MTTMITHAHASRYARLMFPFKGLKLKSVRTVLLVVVGLLLMCTAASAESYPNKQTKDILWQSQEFLFNDRFDSAHIVLDSLIYRSTGDPLGYLFKAAVYLGQMTDAEEEIYTAEFKSLLDTIEALALSRMEGTTSRDSAWMHLCRGHAQAYRSLWESRFGSFTSALKQAFKARSSYEVGLKADSTLYDLYGGLGMYHYWKSAKAGILRWFRIFKNDKQKGIDELYLAVDSSEISRQISRNALIYIRLDKKEYDSVIVICREMFEKFPDGKLFLWPIASAYFEKEEYHKAAEVYLTLRTKLTSAPGNYYNLIECDYNLNRCYDKLKLDKEAIMSARAVSDYYDSISDKIKRRQRSKLNFLRRYAKREW